MRLHEAIEQAGRGGKFCYSKMSDGDYYFIDEHGIFTQFMSGEASNEFVSVKFNKAFFTRDDWEVVKDEVIEVGDVVGTEGDTWGEKEWNVLACSNGIAVLQSLQDPHHVEGARGERPINVADLTLIRKGPKVEVFKGIHDIEWYDKKQNGYATEDADTYYTMTLTVEKVAPELDGRN